jgi:hypothetical protein
MSQLILRQSTATRIQLGVFVDKTDGVTIKNALTITNEKITMVLNTYDGLAPTIILNNVSAASTGGLNNLNYSVAAAGIMEMVLTVANTATLGQGTIYVQDPANHVPVWVNFKIVTQQVFDALEQGTVSPYAGWILP